MQKAQTQTDTSHVKATDAMAALEKTDLGELALAGPLVGKLRTSNKLLPHEMAPVNAKLVERANDIAGAFKTAVENLKMDQITSYTMDSLKDVKTLATNTAKVMTAFFEEPFGGLSGADRALLTANSTTVDTQHAKLKHMIAVKQVWDNIDSTTGEVLGKETVVSPTVYANLLRSLLAPGFANTSYIVREEKINQVANLCKALMKQCALTIRDNTVEKSDCENLMDIIDSLSNLVPLARQAAAGLPTQLESQNLHRTLRVKELMSTVEKEKKKDDSTAAKMNATMVTLGAATKLMAKAPSQADKKVIFDAQMAQFADFQRDAELVLDAHLNDCGTEIQNEADAKGTELENVLSTAVEAADEDTTEEALLEMGAKLLDAVHVNTVKMAQLKLKDVQQQHLKFVEQWKPGQEVTGPTLEKLKMGSAEILQSRVLELLRDKTTDVAASNLVNERPSHLLRVLMRATWRWGTVVNAYQLSCLHGPTGQLIVSQKPVVATLSVSSV